jgi:branched-chain amino acid transport system permease protein
LSDLAALIVQQSLNGVYLGCLYVMVALGLTLIYGVLVQINFAHADFVTLGAFAAYFFTHSLGGNYLLGIAFACAVGAALGWLTNALVFAPLRERGSELLPLIATIGVSIMLENAMLAWFGPIPYAFETPYSQQVFRVAGTFFTLQSVIILAVSIVTIAALYGFMKFTYLGKALRAVAQDREAALALGIETDRLYAIAWGISAAAAGIAGALVSTRRATTLAFAQAGSTAATRATLARTAMIFAARSDPRAIVLIATDILLIRSPGNDSQSCKLNCERGYNTEKGEVKIC